MVRIRKFRISDAECLSKLIIQTLTEINSKDYSVQAISKMCEKFSPKGIIDRSKKRDFVLVAVDKDELLGTVNFRGGELLGLFVSSHHLGQGIGRKLVAYTEKKAKELGHDKISIPSSITAFDFYKKLGYKKVKFLQDTKNGPVIIMTKMLI